MSRTVCLTMSVLCVATALSRWLHADEKTDDRLVRAAMMQRFDENRNDKLESVEAQAARVRLRTLLDDSSTREVNILAWREDVRELLHTLDPDQNHRLSSIEREMAAVVLDRIIPKTDRDQRDAAAKRHGQSTVSPEGDRKRPHDNSATGLATRHKVDPGAFGGAPLGGGGFGSHVGGFVDRGVADGGASTGKVSWQRPGLDDPKTGKSISRQADVLRVKRVEVGPLADRHSGPELDGSQTKALSRSDVAAESENSGSKREAETAHSDPLVTAGNGRIDKEKPMGSPSPKEGGGSSGAAKPTFTPAVLRPNF